MGEVNKERPESQFVIYKRKIRRKSDWKVVLSVKKENNHSEKANYVWDNNSEKDDIKAAHTTPSFRNDKAINRVMKKLPTFTWQRKLTKTTKKIKTETIISNISFKKTAISKKNRHVQSQKPKDIRTNSRQQKTSATNKIKNWNFWLLRHPLTANKACWWSSRLPAFSPSVPLHLK